MEWKLVLVERVDVGVRIAELGRESKNSFDVGVSIGLRICDVDVEVVDADADGLSSNSTPTDVMIRPVSFAAIAAFSFVFVIPDKHFPLSRCCSCPDEQLNRLLHFSTARHLISLSG